MSREALNRSLQAVVIRVLEDAAFVFSDELSKNAKPYEPDWNPSGVSLSFTGEMGGVFRLWADASLLPLLTANMLGLEPGSDLSGEKGIDALKETANIMLGNFLTDYFGTKAVFNLGIPADADPVLKKNDCLNDSGVWLQAEGNTLLATIELDDRATKAG